MNGPTPLTIHTLDLPGVYSDSRTHWPAPQETNGRPPSNPDVIRNVRLPRATPSGGTISRSEDGRRCAVAGTEYLRIIRVSDPDDKHPSTDHKSNVGAGGYRLDASRNMWEGSGLKTDSANTDVAWCHGSFNHKILTSARNGDLIMWDLNKSGSSKYERKTKDHSRSIHKLAVSPVVHHYVVTGSADGDMRVWDIKDMEKSIMRIRHPTAVRGLAFSPSSSTPLQAIVGLDNGSIYRWELRMGQRGLLDRLPVAHTASVTSLDWHLPDGSENEATCGLGWVVSAGLDRCVKVYCFTNSCCNPNTSVGHIPHKPTYTLHPSFPVRRVLWRPGYECEVAVVSNAHAEFGSGNFSDLEGPVPGPTYASALAVGSARAGNVPTSNALGSMAAGPGKEGRERGSGSGIGDAVEIWDARRGWIAKWTVRGSSIEGGVTDIAFRDSHAIWATHSSGMFSQIDLREASKPIDSIPRMAAAWEASGSLAFVADRKFRWEAPYDDMYSTTENRKARKLTKSIGDEPCKPDTQTVGTYTSESVAEEVDMFTKLAKGYIFEGEDRRVLCEMNAQIAFEAGKVQVAQTWLLLASSLTTLVPELPPTPPRSPPAPHSALPTSASAPPAIASNYSFPPIPNLDASDLVTKSDKSPGRASSKASPHEARSSSTSTSRKLTPTSSSASSPRLQVGSLPPVTPRPPSRSAYMGRRQSGDSGVGGSRRPPHYRKLSMSSSLPSSSGASPNNTRHIGEGALDDSDSSSSGSTGVDVGDEMTIDGGAASSDEDSAIVSPSLMPTRMMTAAHPSPLSKIAGLQQWPEHEEEEAADQVDDDETSSPSPMSTDTDKSSEDGGDLHFKSLRQRQKSKSSINRNPRLKSRSRSSTLASLAAPALSRTLVHQSSHSSMLTVTAGETSFHDSGAGVKAEETLRDIRGVHRHQKSQAVSDFLLDQKEVMDESRLKDLPSVDESKLTERRMEFVHADEDGIRQMTWEILREALESFAGEGDVQTCAMLVVVAPQELQIGPKRTLRFLESYIDILTRMQLHACAAYLRKFCQSEDVRSSTLLETQIHTSCGKCRKPLVVSAGIQTPGTLVKGGFAFCLACKAACVTCAICRLPVRTLLFQCSICHHGGHQACYRRYYMEHPMVPIPSALVLSSESRGRQRSRTADDETTLDGSSQDDYPGTPFQPQVKRLGHPCVSGCGHWCWAAAAD
ncbi:hypothetical protein C8F04DRAFT_938106 [Mycena alexandri]|uniref:WD repeat-containing protein 24 n=1 Tax=Mycena alexandri TaxID=1745969 RepID=A0AAD6XEC3_9AGAR|nr:hypothetical protein C8F04DRAFT_938106 [Mycena alexandri]